MKVFDEIRKKNDEAKLEEIDSDVQEAIEAVRKVNAQGCAGY